jgi:hypothetical protein
MNHIYYIDGKRFITKNFNHIPKNLISSPNDETPAYEDLENGYKIWSKNDWRWHRLTGPANIDSDGDKSYWLDGRYYSTDIGAWIKDHPNPDLYFDALGWNETDKVLWFLQN